MALWEIKSPMLASHEFNLVRPVEILAEFDGPLTFTFRNGRGILFLANLSATGPEASRYLVCEIDDLRVLELKNGMIDLRSALVRPPLWLVDIRRDWTVANVWIANTADLPDEVVPEHGALLTAELEAEQP